MFSSYYGAQLPNKGLSVRKVCSRYSPCAGFSYIEVLLSLAIFSVSMLGFLHVQILNARLANESLVNYQASLIVESVREQVSAVGKLMDEGRWQERVKDILPGGQISLNSEVGIVELDLSWLSSQGRDNIDPIRKLTARIAIKDE